LFYGAEKLSEQEVSRMKIKTRKLSSTLCAAVATAGIFSVAPGVGLLSATPVQAQNQAKPVTTNVQIPLDNLPVTVNGQTYQVNGNLHGLFHVNRDSAGGLHVKAHLNGQGVQITGANTTYRGTGAANLTINLGATKGAATNFTGVANVGLIGQGQTPNYRLHVNVHGTINANGEVTATVANVKLTS
jgi:hypothetical protein